MPAVITHNRLFPPCTDFNCQLLNNIFILPVAIMHDRFFFSMYNLFLLRLFDLRHTRLLNQVPFTRHRSSNNISRRSIRRHLFPSCNVKRSFATVFVTAKNKYRLWRRNRTAKMSRRLLMSFILLIYDFITHLCAVL